MRSAQFSPYLRQIHHVRPSERLTYTHLKSHLWKIIKKNNQSSKIFLLFSGDSCWPLVFIDFPIFSLFIFLALPPFFGISFLKFAVTRLLLGNLLFFFFLLFWKAKEFIIYMHEGNTLHHRCRSGWSPGEIYEMSLEEASCCPSHRCVGIFTWSSYWVTIRVKTAERIDPTLFPIRQEHCNSEGGGLAFLPDLSPYLCCLPMDRGLSWASIDRAQKLVEPPTRLDHDYLEIESEQKAVKSNQDSLRDLWAVKQRNNGFRGSELRPDHKNWHVI